MTFRPVVARALCEERLKACFPPGAFDTMMANPVAAASVAAMIYVGAVVNDDGDPLPENVWARPNTITSMSDVVLTHTSDDEREAWAEAEAKSAKHTAALMQAWDHEHKPWYANNSREGVRDETWPLWRGKNAARKREGLATSSSKPRWALTASFADLFDPTLTGGALEVAIDAWRQAHMTPGDLLKIQYANDLAQATHQTPVLIPGFGIRYLEPGVASAILKGVVEEWAPRRLQTPVIVAISEPGQKVWTLDATKMAAAGISINVSSVLPDAIILDAGSAPPTFWIIEAVASDGEVNEGRKIDLLTWAADQYIDPDRCQFLSAFTSRNSPPARKRFKDLAVGTYAWFLDEPDNELAWNELPTR
jgi:hypothetical protein